MTGSEPHVLSRASPCLISSFVHPLAGTFQHTSPAESSPETENEQYAARSGTEIAQPWVKGKQPQLDNVEQLWT